MIVNVTNGQNIINILSDGFVTCLKIKKPVALDWYDCAGSSGKYFSCTTDYETISVQFNETLINGDDDQILNAVSGFLQLFAAGQYNVYIDRNERNDYELHTEYSAEDSLDKFHYGYYNPGGENLMFTQSKTTINNDRVKHYETLILNGLKPKAIVFQACFNDYGTYEDGSEWMSTVDSPMFILDGHHKLIAYQNLNLQPEFVLISKEAEGEIEFAQNENLYFDYQYFLIADSKQHIISHRPKLLTDQSFSSTEYNFHFDHYLKAATSVQTKVLKLFKEALQTNEPGNIEWLICKLDVLQNRPFDVTNLWLNYYTVTTEYPKGIWDCMAIKSQTDFKDWTRKLFGKSIDEIKEMKI